MSQVSSMGYPIQKSLASLWKKIRKSPSLFFLTCCAAATDVLLTRLIAIKLYRKWKGYPPGPVGLPFLGSAIAFLRSPYATLAGIGSYGKMTSVQLGWNLNIFINDVATARKVMHHNCIGVERPPFANPPLLMHFLAINGEKWKQRRGHFTSQVAAKVANSQYSYDIIQDAITNSIVPDLDRIVATDGLWYPARHCSFIDMNLMFNVLYGFNLSLNEDPTGYVDQLLPVPEIWFKSITNVLVLAACSPFRVGSWIFNKFTNNHNDLESTAANVLVECMQKLGFEFDAEHNSVRRKSKAERTAFIDHLIEKTDMGADVIMADIALALIAGTNTTSKAMGYGFLLLSRHPDVQQRIYEELKSLRDPRKDLHRAYVLRAFIQETLRLSVVSPLGFPHYAAKEVVVDGMVIPKGAVVHSNMYYMHRVAGGDVLDVDQWLDKDGKFKNDTGKFMMFGSGKRSCPGQGIAMKLLNYVFSMLIVQYEMKAVDHREIVQQFAWVPVVEPAIGIKLQKRNTAVKSVKRRTSGKGVYA